MTLPRTSYNERAWAIDLIAHIKQVAARTNRPVKDAGGERTIGAEGGSLFPDVLLFGDRETARILQGWELKMPDTPIHDYRYRQNAETKANALGLDSFLLWNVSIAHLYTRESPQESFLLAKEWSNLADITTRSGVLPNRSRWKSLAEEIVGYVNILFDSGSLEGRQFIEAYRSGGITSLVLQNYGLVADALAHAANRDHMLRSRMALWWARYRAEYTGETREKALGQAVIANWIGKLLFAHILSETDERAKRAIVIDADTTPGMALEAFRRLSRECDFWPIFSDSIGLREVPGESWRQLRQFNQLLGDLRVGSIDQQQLADILQSTVEVTRRKVRGQYATPSSLARLLINLCVRDRVGDRVLDPCCGSGTIARAALEAKMRTGGVSAEEAAASVWAGDQDPQAVQIATLGLAEPSLMHTLLRVFREDAYSLTPSKVIEFRHPSDGSVVPEELGRFDAIVGNLPFVAQDGRQHYTTAIRRVNGFLEKEYRLPGRADVAAYLPFALHPLLKKGGRLGIIITNAWLGTDWGAAFLNALLQYYNLKCVITSGAGRWFKNSEVVTNILIAERPANNEERDQDIAFVVLKRPLDDMAADDAQLVASQIELRQPQIETMSIRTVRYATLARCRNLGMDGSAQFVECDWIHELPLVPVKGLFRIRRGERRGMNALFYPEGDHGIEGEYIRPLLKSPNEFETLRGHAVREAFTCSRSEQELAAMGHTGALQWIDRFKSEENMTKLRRAHLRWYEMNATEVSNLVMFINLGERLFVGHVDPPAFVDQRMVRLDGRDGVDVLLCHALLNSTIGLFMIEGLGFGRGLGALDLNKTRIEKRLHMLDPGALGKEARRDIMQAFEPVANREVMNLADELEQEDRRRFDESVIDAFELEVARGNVYDTLLELFGIRLCARE